MFIFSRSWGSSEFLRGLRRLLGIDVHVGDDERGRVSYTNYSINTEIACEIVVCFGQQTTAIISIPDQPQEAIKFYRLARGMFYAVP